AAAAARLRAWIDEATSTGARLLCGGAGTAQLLPACVLENVAHNARLWREEAFGPVAVLEPFNDFDAALHTVNDSTYGLQAGVFTDSMTHALRAWDVLEVGGVIVGDVPSFRVDNMPYGGVKRSGLGREGIRAAIGEMTESRLLVIRDGT
ncbi:MAG: aldehyde dehydrogenase family protein, partial [Pseudomonadota bacterium]|nr:aldehyde dehydrogenase family protein [Pseudomonadota bacterium]